MPFLKGSREVPFSKQARVLLQEFWRILKLILIYGSNW